MPSQERPGLNERDLKEALGIYEKDEESEEEPASGEKKDEGPSTSKILLH